MQKHELGPLIFPQFLFKAEGLGAWSKEMTNEVVASGVRILATYREIEQ